jgi:4-hydroxybenzoate polyprenyltransferase
VLAGLLAIIAGHRPGGIALVGGAVLASQAGIGWGNDAIDAERDRIAGRADKPLAGEWPQGRRTVLIAAIIASLASVAIAAIAGLAAGLIVALAVIAAQLYNWPLKATPISIVPYLICFGALPAFIVITVPAPMPVPLVVAGALFGGAAHLLNVQPDLADDVATGIRGLPHRLGPGRSRALAAVLVLGATYALIGTGLSG